MTDLDYYLTEDHAARTRTMLISIAAGVGCAGLAATVWGLPDKTVAFICGAVTIGTEITRALTYTRKYTSNYSESPLLLRRYLIRLAVSLPVFLAVPALQAGFVDRKLLKAIQEGPPYNKAKRLLIFGLRNGIAVHITTLDITQETVSQAYMSLPEKEREEAGATLAQILVYELYVKTNVRLAVGIGVVFIPGDQSGGGTFRIENSVRSPYVAMVGQDKNHAGLEVDFDNTPKTPAVLIYSNTVGGGPHPDAILADLSVKRPLERNLANAPAFVLTEASHQKVAIMDVVVSNLSQALDTIIWVDVTFDRCRISYDGGPLLLKNVIFNDCEFESSPVLDKIRSHGGNPVTLDIS